MKKMRIGLLIILIGLIVGVGNLSARDTPIALGFQAGFAATGVVVDVELGTLSLNAGVNYPLGYSYIAALADADSEDQFPKLATLTADVSSAFALSETFDVKVGIGGIILTNFGPAFGGLVGPVLKGEYWMPEKNMGLFLNINVPVMLFGGVAEDIGDVSGGEVFFSPWLPLAGLLTTTVGVLYGF